MVVFNHARQSIETPKIYKSQQVSLRKSCKSTRPMPPRINDLHQKLACHMTSSLENEFSFRRNINEQAQQMHDKKQAKSRNITHKNIYYNQSANELINKSSPHAQTTADQMNDDSQNLYMKKSAKTAKGQGFQRSDYLVKSQKLEKQISRTLRDEHYRRAVNTTTLSCLTE